MCASAAPSVASAREDYCLTPGTKTIDQTATAGFRRLESQSNPAVMRALNGVWLSVQPSPATHQISYLYESFSTGGLYGYTNYVCTSQNTFCSKYEGVGVYAVRATSATDFFGVKDVSDTVRLDHACLSLGGRFLSANAYVAGNQIHRRVR